MLYNFLFWTLSIFIHLAFYILYYCTYSRHYQTQRQYKVKFILTLIKHFVVNDKTKERFLSRKKGRLAPQQQNDIISRMSFDSFSHPTIHIYLSHAPHSIHYQKSVTCHAVRVPWQPLFHFVHIPQVEQKWPESSLLSQTNLTTTLLTVVFQVTSHFLRSFFEAWS